MSSRLFSAGDDTGKQTGEKRVVNKKTDYVIHTDVRYRPLELVDVPALAAACTDPWWNQTLCVVNDSVLRLGILKGEFHWHKHDDEDEHFFVLEGELLVDTRSVDTGDADTAVTTFPLGAKQGVTVPRGTMHRTRSAEGAVVLMIAGRDVVPTGD